MLILYYFVLCCRVVEIMRRDSQKDPSTDPDATRARLILDQVLLFCQYIFNPYYMLPHKIDKVKFES